MSGLFGERQTRQAIVVPLGEPAGQGGAGPGMAVVLLVLALVAVLAAPRLLAVLDLGKRERDARLEEARIADQQAETKIKQDKAAADAQREADKAAADARRDEERHQAHLRFVAGLGESAELAGYGALTLPFVWGAVRLAQLAVSEARRERRERYDRQAQQASLARQPQPAAQARPAAPPRRATRPLPTLEDKRRAREQRHAFLRLQHQFEQARQRNDQLQSELARERARQALAVLPETTNN